MQIAVITGASAGIGRATALETAAHGVGVIMTYRSREAEALEVAAAIEKDGGSAVAMALDVADTSSFASFVTQVERVLATWGERRLHALVNNAGIGGGAPFPEVTEEMFDRFHRTLFRGPYFLTQRLLPLIADGGVIVNVGSNSALPTGTSPGYSSYASQKGAVHTLTRYWAKELAPRGIRVNAVAPGSTRTRIADDAFDRAPEAAEAAAAVTAFGRVGEPEDVGRVIAGLLDDAGAWITGQIIEASGGQGL